METPNYRYSFVVPSTSAQVHDAITRVTAWWTVNTDGSTKQAGDEFTVQFGDVHLTRQRITESLAGKCIVWSVTESHLPWLKDLEEWKGTEMVFAIEPEEAGTRLTFTHIGLTSSVECFDQCEKGWDFFIGTSLFKLITTGTGQPDTTGRTHLDVIGHVHPKNA